MKKPASTIDNIQRSASRSGGCGCFATGCGIVALLFLTMCVGSYVLTMHSSIPLALIEAALEEDGNVQVDGLRGSISSGFEIDVLRFQSDDVPEKWNELRDIKFTYNGFVNMVRTQRVIIGEASIGSATIYADIDGDEDNANLAFDGEKFVREITEEWTELQTELREDEARDLKELRVDLLSAQNIVVIDPVTDYRLELQKAEFKNFWMMDGQIKRVGDLQVLSDQVDLQSGPSSRFSDETFAWQISGTLKPAALKAVIRELPFQLDFAVIDANESRLHADLCHGQVVIDEPYGELRNIHLRGFSHGEYFQMTSQLQPSSWQVDFTIETEPYEVAAPPPETVEEETVEEETAEEERAEEETAEEDVQAKDPGGEDGVASSTPEAPLPPGNRPATPRSPRMVIKHQHKVTIEPGGTFVLGQTLFQIETSQVVLGPKRAQMQPEFIIAKAKINDLPVLARLRLQRIAPWFTVTLQATGVAPRDLWARLFFEQDYSKLDSEQQMQVNQAVLPIGTIPRELESSVPVDF